MFDLRIRTSCAVTLPDDPGGVENELDDEGGFVGEDRSGGAGAARQQTIPATLPVGGSIFAMPNNAHLSWICAMEHETSAIIKRMRYKIDRSISTVLTHPRPRTVGQ